MNHQLLPEILAVFHGDIRWMIRFPLPGSVFEAFRAGKATDPDQIAGIAGRKQWLAGHSESPGGSGDRHESGTRDGVESTVRSAARQPYRLR